jgi:hypothetical protein
MNNIDMDVVNVPEQAIIIELHMMLLEETEAFTDRQSIHGIKSLHANW